MLSTLILSEHSYLAMHLAVQPAHHWFVHFGPLVLEAAPLKYPAPTKDRDQTVSRRFEPNSRTALIGEQPNPWDLVLFSYITIGARLCLHHILNVTTQRLGANRVIDILVDSSISHCY